VPQYNTFVVRIWTDDDHGLHGQITHVASQDKCDFRDLDRMLEFMVEHIHPYEGSAEVGGEEKESRGEQ